MTARVTVPTAAEVRAWGRKQNAENGTNFAGVDEGTRGRLNPELVSAFNAGRKSDRQYVEGNKAPKTVAVSVPTGKGNRTRTVQVVPAEARAAALAAGREVGTKGRLPESVLVDFATGALSL